MKHTQQQIDIINKGIEYAESIHKEAQRTVEGKNANVSLSSVVSITLFMRIQDIYSGIIACVRIGKPVNSYILLRTMTEALVLLKGATTDEKFSKELHNKSVAGKKRRIDSLVRDFGNTGMTFTKAELDALKKKTEEDMAKDAGHAADAYSIFKRFNALSLYHQTFTHCSLYVHNDPLSLSDYILSDKDGKFELGYNKDVFKDSGLCLLMAMSTMLYALEQICKFLKIEDYNKELLATKYNDFQNEFGIELKLTT